MVGQRDILRDGQSDGQRVWMERWTERWTEAIQPGQRTKLKSRWTAPLSILRLLKEENV
jgi:hypothetical protein